MSKKIVKELEKDARLVFEVYHGCGAYRVSVRREKIENRPWGSVIICEPFADGNFCIKLGEKRKSEARLTKIESFLKNNLDELFNKWTAGNYQGIADSIFAANLMQ